MPYLCTRATVQPFVPTRRRRRGMSGLGDCQPYAQWTNAIVSNIPLPNVFDANCPISQNGVLTPCAVQAQQMSTAIQDVQIQLGECIPTGTVITVTLDGSGKPTDTPAYSIQVPGGPSWNQPKTSDINYVPPPLTPTAAGIMASGASALEAVGLPVTQETALAAVNPLAAVVGQPTGGGSSTAGGGSAVGSAAGSHAGGSSGGGAGASSGGAVSSSGSNAAAGTISPWVWIGGAALLLWLLSGGSK